MTVLGNRVFADVCSQGYRDEIILNLGLALSPMTGMHIRGGEDTRTQRYREEGRVTAEAGVEGKHRKPRTPKIEEPAGNRQRFFSGVLRENMALLTS